MKKKRKGRVEETILHMNFMYHNAEKIEACQAHDIPAQQDAIIANLRVSFLNSVPIRNDRKESLCWLRWLELLALLEREDSFVWCD